MSGAPVSGSGVPADGHGATAPGGSDAPVTMPPPATSPRRPARRSRLGWQLILLIAALLVASAIATTWFSVSSLFQTTTAEAEASMGNAHRIVADLVGIATDDVAAYRQAALDQRELELKDISAAMVGAIDRLRLAISPDGASEEAAKAAALDLLRATRYRNEDYFFTLDRDLVMIEHPNPDWDGRPVAVYTDPSGRFIFREMRDVVETQGAGYVPYVWARLGASEPVAKISHVEPYAPWGWIVGTGVYIDDIDAEAAAQLAALESRLATTFDTIELGPSGTIFILGADRKSTRLNSSHVALSRMPSSA